MRLVVSQLVFLSALLFFPLPGIAQQFVSISDVFPYEKNQRLYLDLPENQQTTLFSSPGFDWKNCSGACEKIAWPDRQSEITYLGEFVDREMEEPFLGKTIKKRFRKVRVTYTNARGEKIDRSGWMPSESLHSAELPHIYGEDDKGSKSLFNCGPQDKKTPKQKLGFSEQITNQSNAHLADAVTQLRDKVGQCVLSPPKNVSPVSAEIPYDQMVHAKLKDENPPKIKNEQGTHMTKEDLINIDALARTLYAEMAQCYASGLQYPMTVARIIMNRAEYIQKVPGDGTTAYARGKHDQGKPTIAKVATQPGQFSVWNLKNNQSGLSHTLCPPSSPNKNFWQGGRPSAIENIIWTQTLTIATEAILHPNEFKRKTQDNVYLNYTSGKGEFYAMTKVTPRVQNRFVDNSQCIEVWNDKTRVATLKGEPPPAPKTARAPATKKPSKKSKKK